MPIPLIIPMFLAAMGGAGMLAAGGKFGEELFEKRKARQRGQGIRDALAAYEADTPGGTGAGMDAYRNWTAQGLMAGQQDQGGPGLLGGESPDMDVADPWESPYGTDPRTPGLGSWFGVPWEGAGARAANQGPEGMPGNPYAPTWGQRASDVAAQQRADLIGQAGTISQEEMDRRAAEIDAYEDSEQGVPVGVVGKRTPPSAPAPAPAMLQGATSRGAEGLLGDPNIGRELRLAAGMMGTPWAGDQGSNLMGSIITNQVNNRAQAERLRATLGVQVGLNDRQEAIDTMKVNRAREQFDRQMGNVDRQFNEDVRQYGLDFAQKQKENNRNFLLKQAELLMTGAANANKYPEGGPGALGKAEKGGFYYADPSSPTGTIVRYPVGSEGHTTRVEWLDESAVLQANIRGLMNVMKSGSTFAPGVKQNEAMKYYTDILDQIRKLKGYGALNGAYEIEALERGLPNPTTFGRDDPALRSYEMTLQAAEKTWALKKQRFERQGVYPEVPVVTTEERNQKRALPPGMKRGPGD